MVLFSYFKAAPTLRDLRNENYLTALSSTESFLNECQNWSIFTSITLYEVTAPHFPFEIIYSERLLLSHQS